MRRRVVFFTFVILVAVAAIFLTMKTSPAPAIDPGFNTPTTTPTATDTPVASPTPDVFLTSENSSAGSSTNCTYTLETWKQYPEAWGLSSIRIGSSVFSKDEVLALFNSTAQDGEIQLLQQLFIVVINQSNGANPDAIIQTLSATTDWLSQHPYGSSLDDTARVQAATYAKVLQDFNEGKTGPGLCTKPILTPTPTATYTPEASPTPTATLTPIFTPTRTRGPTSPFKPPATPVPTRDRPDRPKPPTATQPPPPQPTQPPPQPTEPPPPQPTQPPPPTPAPTSASTTAP
jgi:hypothetical protein